MNRLAVRRYARCIAHDILALTTALLLLAGCSKQAPAPNPSNLPRPTNPYDGKVK